MELKKATKSSSRAKLNININKSNNKNVSKTNKTIKKQIKSLNKISLLFCFIAIIIGFAIGVVGFNLICKNDCFVIIGNDEITLELDEKYVEKGAQIIEFGKDISNQVKIETNLIFDEDGYSTETGTFYVKYSIDSIKYGKVFKIEKIKLVTFVEISEGGV